MIRRLLAHVPELQRLRLSSIDPAAIDEELWALIGSEPRLMPHLHMSMQAGSDLILKRMRRRHSRRQALEVVERARELRPDVAFGADLIAGFPTETDELFEETLAFVAAAGLAYLHVFPYSERPGTPAARMPSVPVPVRRARAKILREAGAAGAARLHATLVGRTLSVLTETADSGHAEQFAPVRLARPCEPGQIVLARVLSGSAAGVVAEPV
jgi:threonylcarbamoyladenosine tRNA methylthiotransferase MtaB